MKPKDILIVAPYNLAVRCIRERVPDGVEVSTVDRFQGRQAPVVFHAMTCSSGEEAPRGIEFVLDDHRLNVAVSRAQCLAILVHSPRLLDADCRTLHAKELLDGACDFVEATSRESCAASAATDRQTPNPLSAEEGETENDATRRYRVLVDDNYSYQRSEESYTAGELDDFESALGKCQEIVERSLREAFKPGMESDRLHEAYMMFGEEPWIACPAGDDRTFSARGFARTRCPRLVRTRE